MSLRQYQLLVEGWVTHNCEQKTKPPTEDEEAEVGRKYAEMQANRAKKTKEKGSLTAVV